jgi:hypothetical protein
MLKEAGRTAEEILRELKETAKEAYEKTQCETRTPWPGPGKKFNPNDPPDPNEPKWKRVAWAIMRLINTWLH